MLPVPTRPRPPSRPTGVSAYALLARRDNLGNLGPHELEAWLLENGLAVPDGAPGLLVPTARALELGSYIDFLG